MEDNQAKKETSTGTPNEVEKPAGENTDTAAKASESVEGKKDGESGQEKESNQKADGNSQQQTPEAKEKSIPDKYDLKLPEGSLLDEAFISNFETYAKEKKMSQEEAAASFQRDHDLVTGVMNAKINSFKKEAEGWVTQVKNDKEIGGQNLNKNIEMAKRFIDHFAEPAFKELLAETGYQNHPELVRMIVRASKAIHEDEFLNSDQRVPKNQKSIAQKMYPNHPHQ